MSVIISTHGRTILAGVPEFHLLSVKKKVASDALDGSITTNHRFSHRE